MGKRVLKLGKKSDLLAVLFVIIFLLLITTIYINEILKINSNKKISGKVISGNEITLDNCNELNQAGEYILTKDIIGSGINSTHCFYIASDNVEFDCNGFSIINDGSYLAAIYASDVSKIIIRNCNISVNLGSSDYLYGIFLNNVQDSFLIENTISKTNTAIEIDLSSKVTVFSNKFVMNSIGLALASSSNNNISKNTGISNNAAIYTQLNSNNNYISDNLLSEGSGIILDETSSGNSLINNEITDIIDWGISLTSSTGNKIIDNFIYSGDNTGILLQKNSHDNQISNNIVDKFPIPLNIVQSNNNKFYNSIFASSSQKDIVLSGNSLNNLFVNSSYDNNKESVQSGELIRKWYLDIFVSDGNKSLDKVAIRVLNSSSDLIFSSNTDSNGYNREILTEYINKNNNRHYSSNYSILLTKKDYDTRLVSILMTGNKNLSFILSKSNLTYYSKENDSIKDPYNENISANKKNTDYNLSNGDKTTADIGNISDIDKFTIYSSLNKAGCIPELECNDWDVCRGNYDLSTITENQVFLRGIRSRVCIDKNDCLYNIIEFKKCEDRIPIKIINGSGCYEGYLVIYNMDNNLISILQREPKNSLNINLLLDNSNYCPYCYNGIKDHDEEEVDCGGSCAGCSYNLPSSYNFFNIWEIIIIFVGVFMVFLSFIAFIRYLKSRRQITLMNKSYNEI